jgi:hypothetical protein
LGYCAVFLVRSHPIVSEITLRVKTNVW